MMDLSGEIESGMTIPGESGAAQAAPEASAAPARDLDGLDDGGSAGRQSQQTGAGDETVAVASSRPVAEALQAAAEQLKRDRDADASGAAALAQALKTFVDTFAGQNAPSRSEFRDLAARLDRLSSQFQKGR